MNIIVAWDQNRQLPVHNLDKLSPKVIRVKLSNYEMEVKHTVVGGRVRNFPIAFSGHCHNVPILAPSALAKLIVRYYHDKYHKEIDTIVIVNTL